MSQKLLSILADSSDQESDVEFSINKNYADRYDVWRNKEELQKLKDLSKDISDSSSESEEEVEPVVEKDFFRVMSLLMGKDPRIYDKNVVFFKDEESTEKKPKVKKEKPMFMKDYERKLVLERNGEFSDDEEHIPTQGPTYKEEQEEIKKGFKEFVKDSDDEEEDELLQVRTKTKEEEDKEQVDYKKWLETEKDMAHLNKFWNDPKLSEDDKFLRDYILNEGYKDDDKLGQIPTYAEITEDVVTLSEDERIVQEQEEYEHKYNFRFEEPDEDFIKRYPRTVGDSLRRMDNRRKLKREDYAERKRKEKEQKREELKRLKALKRKEIEEKFLKLKEVCGQEELNLDENDIEDDFDPDKHDQKMKELFNDDYYGVEEHQKPEFSYDDELDDENWNQWSRKQVGGTTSKRNEHEGDSGDAVGYHQDNPRHQFEQEMIDATQSGKKKGRKKSLFAKVVSQPKPLFDPDSKSFDKYLDEYYKLDYEDTIGDLPVRFKYRKVVPNDFGLSVDEILAANDKELNRWCSVKKTCQYRREEEEKYDIQAFKKKAENIAAKQKILTSVYSQPQEKEEVAEVNTPTDVNTKRKKKSKKRKKNAENTLITNAGERVSNDNTEVPNLISEQTDSAVTSDNVVEKKSKKKKSKYLNEVSIEKRSEFDSVSHIQAFEASKMVSDDPSGLSSNGKFKQRGKVQTSLGNSFLLKGNNSTDISVVDTPLAELESSTCEKPGKKKSKRKKSRDMNDEVSFDENPPIFVSGECSDLSAKQLSSSGSKQKRERQTSPENEIVFQSKDCIDTPSLDTSLTKRERKRLKKKMKYIEETNSFLDVNVSKNLNNSDRSSHSLNQEEDSRREGTFANIETKDSEDTSFRDKSNKGKKKKRALDESFEETGLSNSSFSKPPAKKMKTEDSMFNKSESFVLKKEENCNETDASKLKLKKKKKSKNRQDSFHGNASNKRDFHVQTYQPNANFQKTDTDKRLTLSDARLAAFGINPKKFRNSIIYNKK